MQPLTLRALGTTGLIWGCELALARLTSRQLEVTEVATSLLILISATLPFIGLASATSPASLRSSPWRARLLGAAGSAPLALVAGGQIAAASMIGGGAGSAAGALLFAVAIAVYGALRTHGHNDAIPGPTACLGVLFCTGAASWTLRDSGLPPPELTLSVLAAWVLLGGLASTARFRFAAPCVSLVLALWPSTVPDVRWEATGPVPSGPDLVLITVDTLRADDAAKMESYRRLARAGTSFSDAQTSSPWTLPSLASIMTGLPAASHGAEKLATPGEFSPIREDIGVLAERLASHGYDTAAVVAPNPWLGRSFGFARGFSVFDHLQELSANAMPRIERAGDAHPVLAELVWMLARGRRPFGDAAEIVDRSLGVLKQRRDRPLFLWLHFLDPHLPYRHVDETSLTWQRQMALGLLPGQRRRVLGDPTWAEVSGREALREAYVHEVMQLDDDLNRLLDELGSTPERGRVIVLTGDHGEEFFEHESFEHGHALYGEVVNVPLVVSGLPDGPSPGGPTIRGHVETRPVGVIDIAPTLLAAAGVDNSDLPGTALDQDSTDTYYVADSMLYPAKAVHQFAVRHGKWKAIFGKGEPELFDLSADRDEEHDIAAEHPDITKLLSTKRGVRAAREDSSASLSEQQRESLRALGYTVD